MSNVQYEDTSAILSRDVNQMILSDISRSYPTKAALRQLVSSTFGDDAVCDLNWGADSSVIPALTSLMTYCQTHRVFHKLAQVEKLSFVVSMLLGSDLVRIKDASDDGKWVDGDSIPEGTMLAMLIGTLIQHFGTEDCLRGFVADKMKFVESEVTYGTGIAQAVKSLMEASTKRKRFARLCEMSMKFKYDQNLNLTLMMLLTQGAFKARHGGGISISV